MLDERSFQECNILNTYIFKILQQKDVVVNTLPHYSMEIWNQFKVGEQELQEQLKVAKLNDKLLLFKLKHSTVVFTRSKWEFWANQVIFLIYF